MNVSLTLRVLLATACVVASTAAAQLQPVPAGSLPRLQSTSDLPPDQAALFERVRAAYYHPGKTGLECDGKLDWAGVFAKMGAAATNQDGIKALEGMHLHMSASANQDAKVEFVWPLALPDASKSQIEAGGRQMIVGFFKAYWPVANADFVPLAKDKSVMHRDEDGNYVVEGLSGAERITMTIGKDDLLQKIVVQSPLGMDSVTELHYTPPVNPKPNDRTRFSGVDVDQQTGSSNHVRASMNWDYQTVAGVNMPRRLVVQIPGAFDLPVEFQNCSIQTIVQVSAPPK